MPAEDLPSLAEIHNTLNQVPSLQRLAISGPAIEHEFADLAQKEAETSGFLIGDAGPVAWKRMKQTGFVPLEQCFHHALIIFSGSAHAMHCCLHLRRRGFRVVAVMPVTRMSSDYSWREFVEFFADEISWLSLPTEEEIFTLKDQVAAITSHLDVILVNWPLESSFARSSEHPMAPGFSEYLMSGMRDLFLWPATVVAAFGSFAEGPTPGKIGITFNAIGSISEAGSGVYAMRCSLAALSMFVKAARNRWKDVIIVGIHVGLWFPCRNETFAPTSLAYSRQVMPDIAAQLHLDTLSQVSQNHSGKMLRCPLSEIPP